MIDDTVIEPTPEVPYRDPQGTRRDTGYRDPNGNRLFPEDVVRELRAEGARRRLENKELQATRLSAEESHALRVELALTKASIKHNADVELLTAILAKDGRLASIDHTDTDALNELIDKELQARPALKLGTTTPAAPRSVGMQSPTGGPMAPATPRALPTRADLSSMSAEQIADAYKRGDLDSVLGRR